MTQSLLPRAISFALATLITASLLAGIDTLAFTESAANDLMAQATSAAHRMA
jgi:hypothetical protein